MGCVSVKIKNPQHKFMLRVYKNKINQMEILRVAFKYAPEESVKILGKIFQEDQKITKLTKKLTKSQIYVLRDIFFSISSHKIYPINICIS